MSVNLPRYANEFGSQVFAGKITRMEPCAWAQTTHPGAQTLWLDELDAKADMIPAWVNVHQPSVGGYLVVSDDADGTTRCTFQDASAFELNYRRAA